jgi:hypothetical protein
MLQQNKRYMAEKLIRATYNDGRTNIFEVVAMPLLLGSGWHKCAVSREVKVLFIIKQPQLSGGGVHKQRRGHRSPGYICMYVYI